MNEIELSKAIAEGQASEEARGIALRSLQTQMGVSLVNNITKLNESVSALIQFTDRCIVNYLRRMQESVENDLIPTDTLFEIITTVQKNQATIVDLYRKIVQSPNRVFPEDSISSDERNLLALLKSFKDPAQKQRFMKVVEDFMSKENSF